MAHRKTVYFVSDTLKSPDRYNDIAHDLDVTFECSSYQNLLASPADADLVIRPITEANADALGELENALAEAGTVSLLLVVEPEAMSRTRFPVRIPCDFVSSEAGSAELEARIRRLLWPGEEAHSGDFLTIDSMTINFSTYQVQVDGKPVDFTYLEYALLAFLITHPGHAYSRDALLRRVWGFEYYGGSRTVDVHVRRVRAKLGPDVSERLETVRGVGYMWNM